MNTDKLNNKNSENNEAEIKNAITEAAHAFAPPAGLKETIRKRIHSEQPQVAAPRRKILRPWLIGSMTTAAAGILIAVAWFTLNSAAPKTAYAELLEAVHRHRRLLAVFLVERVIGLERVDHLAIVRLPGSRRNKSGQHSTGASLGGLVGLG